MTNRILFTCLLGMFALAGQLQAQSSFGKNSAQLREVSSAELAKPAIPDVQIGDNPNNPLVPRPLILVMRYYSCSPWYPYYIRSVYSSVVPQGQYHVEIDTAGANAVGDNVDGQLVTDILHPAYGLYCCRVLISVPWNLWQPGLAHRFWVKWAWGAPYWCWIDHWWYYWQRPTVTFTLTGAQEVPPTGSAGTATGTVTVDSGGNVYYSIPFSGLTSGLQAAHFHGPAGPGVNAPPIASINLGTSAGQTSGTLSGTVPPSAALLNALQAGQAYVNLHTANFPNGEIRGQVPVIQPGPSIWCPWGPSWWPCFYWSRFLDAWGLTVCHPYCYRWNPFYIPRDFCLYGLRYYFTPLGNVRLPATDVSSPFAVPLVSNMAISPLSGRPWTIYNSVSVAGLVLRPPYYYWPYTPYCSRWYWFRCLPWSLYRYNPPVVQLAIWQSPTGQPVASNFPDAPDPNLPGTMASITTRPIVTQPGDLNGDGFVTAADQANQKAEVGTVAIDSFFDVFTELQN